MFIYLVAPVAALFIIFGLLHIKCLHNWLRSSVRCSLILYNGLICRPAIQTSLNNEDFESNLTPERSLTITNDIDREEYEDVPAQRIAFNTKERLSDVLLGEVGSKSKNLNLPRYSVENILPEEKDRNLGLPAMRPLQLGTTKDDTIRTVKHEGKENIFESLKNSIEKTSYPSSRLNTTQIYNLILKETLKESEARQKLSHNNKNKTNESPMSERKEHLPSSSENEQEDQI